MILVTSVILQLSSFFKWFIRRLILLYRCSLSVSSYIQILKGQVFRLHILALRTRSLPRSKSGQFLFNDFFFLYFLSLSFLMVEIIHDHRMSLRDSAIRHFIIHKRTIILLSHFLGFLLQVLQSSCGYACYRSHRKAVQDRDIFRRYNP